MNALRYHQTWRAGKSQGLAWGFTSQPCLIDAIVAGISHCQPYNFPVDTEINCCGYISVGFIDHIKTPF
jgi:hypothetical protein